MANFTIGIDIAHDATVGELFSELGKLQGNIVSFIAVGPAGGNPYITFSFPTYENASAFLDKTGNTFHGAILSEGERATT